MIQETEEKTTKIATMVIIHAGNARSLVNDAILAAENNDLEMAKAKLDQANQEIRSAHNTQTEVIQDEARGESMPISLLLTHAQDSLMVAMSEVYMAKYIVRLHGRIHQLESQTSNKK